jgi:hypothetical protein
MGGKSKTSSATSTSTTTTAIDRRTVADNGAVVIGDGSNVTMTDLGAIAEAADLAQASIIGSTQLASNAASQAGAIATRALDIGEKSFAEVKAAYQTANEQAQAVASGNRTLAIVGLMVAGVAGAIAFSRMKAR